MTYIPSVSPEVVVEPSPHGNSIMQSIKEFATFSSLLRMLGAIIVVASMSSFLMQDWSAGNDIDRYHMLLGQTLLLAVAGLGMSFVIKENKGARVFFGLSLLSTTLIMTTLGAIIFSVVQWGTTLTHYPSFALWQATDPSVIIPLIGLSVAVIIPVAIFSFLIFARRSASVMTGLFLFTNMLLLIPARESVLIGVVAILGILMPILVIRRLVESDHTLKTPEGYFAMAVILVPALIIVARNVWLYHTDEFLQMALASIVFISIRMNAKSFDDASVTRRVLDIVSMIAGLFVAFPLAELAYEQFGVAHEVAVTILAVTFAAFTLDVSKRSYRFGHRYVTIAMFALVASQLLLLADNGGLLSATIALCVGVFVTFMGMRHKLKIVLGLGVLTMVAAAIQQLHGLIELIDFGNWLTLAIIGTSTIVIASLIERHGAYVKLKWKEFSKPTVSFDDM